MPADAGMRQDVGEWAWQWADRGLPDQEHCEPDEATARRALEKALSDVASEVECAAVQRLPDPQVLIAVHSAIAPQLQVRLFVSMWPPVFCCAAINYI